MQARRGRRYYRKVEALLNELGLADRVQSKVSPKTREAIAKWEVHRGFLGRTAGYCLGVGDVIELHDELFKEERSGDLKETFLHELAHAIDRVENSRSSGHGFPWKDVMHRLGLRGDRCHSYGYLSKSATAPKLVQCAQCSAKFRTKQVEAWVGKSHPSRTCSGTLYKCE